MSETFGEFEFVDLLADELALPNHPWEGDPGDAEDVEDLAAEGTEGPDDADNWEKPEAGENEREWEDPEPEA